MPFVESYKESAITILPCGREFVGNKNKMFSWLKVHKRKCDKCKNFRIEDELYMCERYEKIFNNNNMIVREKLNT